MVKLQYIDPKFYRIVWSLERVNNRYFGSTEYVDLLTLSMLEAPPPKFICGEFLNNYDVQKSTHAELINIFVNTSTYLLSSSVQKLDT